MRIILAVVGLMLGLSVVAQAETVTLDHESRPEKTRGLDRTIDPDTSVYGLKFGATEAEVRAAFGDPRGAILISETQKAFLYGSSHLFVFRKGKFLELRVNKYGVGDHELRRRMESHPFFDSDRWSISPGIRDGMSFGEVQKLLNKPDAKPHYELVVEGKQSSMTLTFSSSTDRQGADKFELMAFSIVHDGG